MTEYLPLTDIETEYKKAIENSIARHPILTLDMFIQLSVQLFNDIKINGLSEAPNEHDDMLLFQYGTNNWGDENGTHTSFNITRQFILPDDEEREEDEEEERIESVFYQLSFSLIYNPTIFRNTNSYESWSKNYKNLEEWVTDIKSTDGYQQLKTSAYKTYELFFTKI